MIKLAYLVSHPIQYQAPLLRLISEHPDIDLTVFFCSNISIDRFVDPEFRHAISWDTPIVEGYKGEFANVVGLSIEKTKELLKELEEFEKKQARL